MSLFSFWKKLKHPDKSIDQSLWEKLDVFHSQPKHKKHHVKTSNKKKSNMDLWNKLDDYYEKQEEKLQTLSRRNSLSDVPMRDING